MALFLSVSVPCWRPSSTAWLPGTTRASSGTGIDPYPDADLSFWIRDYGPAGATIVPLPQEAWASAGAIPVAARPGEWAVVVPLWTREEDMSDLSMEATITESPDGGLSVVIGNVHVL